MTSAQTVDGVLVTWGERLFYPSNRIVRTAPTPRLDTLTRRKAAVIRGRIIATVVRRAPQVMVKVTGGGRGMNAIAAHFRYISKNGRLQVEDDRELTYQGKESLYDRPSNGDAAAHSYRIKDTGAKPSTSCCRCRMAPARRPCSRQHVPLRRANWRATGT